MELQEALKVILPQKIIDFLMGTSDVKITNCKCDLCNKNGLNGAPEPKTIIELINNSIPFYFPDLQNGYSFCKTTKINVPDRVNVGMMYIPSNEYYNIDSIEFALNHLFTTGMSNPYWIEQTAWAHMFYEDGRYIKLNELEKNSARDLMKVARFLFALMPKKTHKSPDYRIGLR